MIKIDKNMSLFEIGKKYPESVKILAKHGLFCFSCVLSKSETLEQGIIGHGFSEKDLNKIIEEINLEIANPSKIIKKNFDISDSAVEELIKIKENKNKNNHYLKITCSKNGEFSMEFILEKEKEDIIFFKENLKILIDKDSFENSKNYIMDFKKYDFGNGFTFEKLEY